jgi:hypothetical protein
MSEESQISKKEHKFNLFFRIIAAKNTQSPNIDDLFKKWFDNVNEYMERKVTRINNKSDKSQTISSEPEPKKIKLWFYASSPQIQ